MKVIGVTGGVGAGKSEVLGYIAEHWNATVVEADEVGYLVMRPGKVCYSSPAIQFARPLTLAIPSPTIRTVPVSSCRIAFS